MTNDRRRRRVALALWAQTRTPPPLSPAERARIDAEVAHLVVRDTHLHATHLAAMVGPLGS